MRRVCFGFRYMLAIGFVFVNSLDRLIYAHTCTVSIQPVYLHRTLMLFVLVVTRVSASLRHTLRRLY